MCKKDMKLCEKIEGADDELRGLLMENVCQEYCCSMKNMAEDLKETLAKVCSIEDWVEDEEFED